VEPGASKKKILEKAPKGQAITPRPNIRFRIISINCIHASKTHNAPLRGF
jgi:hypothetical protein